MQIQVKPAQKLMDVYMEGQLWVFARKKKTKNKNKPVIFSEEG